MPRNVSWRLFVVVGPTISPPSSLSITKLAIGFEVGLLCVVPPPLLDDGDARLPDNDRRYTTLSSKDRPRAESLSHTVKRFLPYWKETIVPSIQSNNNPS